MITQDLRHLTQETIIEIAIEEEATMFSWCRCQTSRSECRDPQLADGTVVHCPE